MANEKREFEVDLKREFRGRVAIAKILGDLAIEVLEAERFRVRWVLVTAQLPLTEEAEEEPEKEVVQ